MKKIISLFQRNYDGDRLVRDEVVPGAEWVLAGEGRATRKFDGACCLVDDGGRRLLKRYEVKKGRKQPERFVAATDIDPATGKQQGWLPVGNGPEDQYFRDAWARAFGLEDGTYELIGPKVQGNPERAAWHVLHRHGAELILGDPRTYEDIKYFLRTACVEGIVWHHPDGRMVKIKAKDFGLSRAGTVGKGE